MRFKNIFIMFKKDKPRFDISEKHVVKHSKVMFKMLKQHYTILGNIEEIDQKGIVKLVKRKYEDDMSFTESSKYKKTCLDVDNFRVATVYHLCICNLLKKKVSVIEYEFYKLLVEKVMMSSIEKGYMSYESLTIKQFRVDPAVLPVEHRQMLNSMDEYAMACELINEKISRLEDPIKFDTYEEYYDYINKEVRKMILEMNDKGFYGTHNEEVMTIACISRIMNLPLVAQGSLYKGADETVDHMPLEMKREIHIKLFNMIKNS